jgi:hypothetical protein
MDVRKVHEEATVTSGGDFVEYAKNGLTKFTLHSTGVAEAILGGFLFAFFSLPLVLF